MEFVFVASTMKPMPGRGCPTSPPKSPGERTNCLTHQVCHLGKLLQMNVSSLSLSISLSSISLHVLFSPAGFEENLSQKA